MPEAARGLGVAVLSQTMAAAQAGRLAAVPVSDVSVPALLALVWRPAPGPALRGFLAHCRRAFAAAG
jgi:DNA-binding transcriptional LysR family regulator